MPAENESKQYSVLYPGTGKTFKITGKFQAMYLGPKIGVAPTVDCGENRVVVLDYRAIVRNPEGAIVFGKSQRSTKKGPKCPQP